MGSLLLLSKTPLGPEWSALSNGGWLNVFVSQGKKSGVFYSAKAWGKSAWAPDSAEMMWGLVPVCKLNSELLLYFYSGALFEVSVMRLQDSSFLGKCNFWSWLPHARNSCHCLCHTVFFFLICFFNLCIKYRQKWSFAPTHCITQSFF